MLEELKTFIAVVEYKNFTRAGEYLNLSQPSVSTHIKNLEKSFGVTLINRSVKQKTVFITENGYKLYERAKEIINLLDITYMEVKDNSNSLKGTLKVGASLTIGEYFLPKFLSLFSKKYPDIDVEIIIENTSLICSHLKDLTLDIGLIEGTPSTGSFNQEYFLKDQLVLAFNPNNSELTNIQSFEELNNHLWVVREDGSGTREYFNMFLESNKIIPNKILVLGSNSAIKEAVKNNLGITLTSSLVTEEAVANGEICINNFNDEYNRYFSYITPKNITMSKAIQVFIDELNNFSKKTNC